MFSPRVTFEIIVISLASIVLPGCAVYYHDRVSGVEHILGFGHLSMKVTPPEEEKQAIIRRASMTGIAVGMDNGSLGMSVGYDQREHILIYDENVAITIERPPSNDFFQFRIGTYPIKPDNLFDTENSSGYKENNHE